MKNQEVIRMSPSVLKVSEQYQSVYGKDEPIDPLLIETIKKEGIKEPLIVGRDNKIVSGVLRWRIALELSNTPQFQRKFQDIPVILTDEEDSITEIIIHNQGRTKTFTQKLREIKILKDEFLPGQGYRADMVSVKKKSKEQLEIVLGLSYSTINRLLAIEQNLDIVFRDDNEAIKKKWELLDTGKLSVTGLHNWLLGQLKKEELPENGEYAEGNVVMFNKSCEDLSDIKSKSVNCVITSVPYYDLRKYGNGKDEIGQEENVNLYISNLVKLLNGIKPKLANNGSIIVNIADCMKKGEMCLVPHRFALEMNKAGWKVKTTILWIKRNPPYTANAQSPNPAHEYIFQFYKDEKPHYDVSWVKNSGDEIKPIIYGDVKEAKEFNLKSVWKFDDEAIETAVNNINPVKKALLSADTNLTHPAMMSEIVAQILVKTFTKPGELVADLFSGVNTTGSVCKVLGRHFVGYEINKGFFHQGVIRTKLAQSPYDKNSLIGSLNLEAA
jgi:DNA modification methylase